MSRPVPRLGGGKKEKAALLLTINVQAMSEALASFKDDAAPLREHLMNEHKTMLKSLKVEPGPLSPLTLTEAKILKAQVVATEKSEGVSDEQFSRVGAVEASVHKTLKGIEQMREDMESLPRILALVTKATNDNNVGALTGGRAKV